MVVFARSDDYFFGVLHSSAHEIWSRREGSQLRDAKSGFRYTSTTTFQTFPFPWNPSKDPDINSLPIIERISHFAKELDQFRNNWLFPQGIGITFSKKLAQKRTLNSLYNSLTEYRNNVKGKKRDPSRWFQNVQEIITLEDMEELDQIHHELDISVMEAYGMPPTFNDDEILHYLLDINLKRAEQKGP